MKQLFIYICCLFLLTGIKVHAAWVGPTEVLNGKWGAGPTEFFVDWGDSPAYAVYPILFDVSANGQVVISDESNGRVKIYGADGVLVRNITPPVPNPKRSTMEPEFIGQNVVIPIDKYYFYSNTGALIGQPDGPGKVIFTGELNGNLYVAENAPNEKWLVYSSNGALLNTFQEKPLELGHIADNVIRHQGKKMYRFTITYPDQQWTIASLSSDICGEYELFRDLAGNLYCAGTKEVVRYSACGKEVASFTIPEDIDTTLSSSPPGSGVEDVVKIEEGYGNIEMGDNGDIYISKVTPTNFSVIKWTWQASPDDKVGGPDAPTDFVANGLGAEVKLAWRPSLQDPGCVAGYEVSRATVAGGPYTVLNTTGIGVKEYVDNTAVSGNTYYYRIRAMSGVANSDYTPEANAVIP